MVQLPHYLLSAFLALASSFTSQQASTQQPRCESVSEYRQLDFWVGDWDVTSEGEKVAASSIQRILGGCVIFENYSQGAAFEGKSFTFYDSALKQWRQTWVDNSGTVSEFNGSFKDGSLHLEGVTHRNNGATVMRRMTLSTLPERRVRQFSQRSLDGGKTWLLAYDFVYVPRASK